MADLDRLLLAYAAVVAVLDDPALGLAALATAAAADGADAVSLGLAALASGLVGAALSLRLEFTNLDPLLALANAGCVFVAIRKADALAVKLERSGDGSWLRRALGDGAPARVLVGGRLVEMGEI